jgi:hypothetical protein
MHRSNSSLYHSNFLHDTSQGEEVSGTDEWSNVPCAAGCLGYAVTYFPPCMKNSENHRFYTVSSHKV